jgi:hypothetical protein
VSGETHYQIKTHNHEKNKTKIGIIKEGEDVITKSFRRSMAGKDIRNLKYVPEEKVIFGDKLNLKKPLPGIKNSIHEEVNSLLEYIYGLNEEFSTFWENHNLTYEDLCEALESKGYLVKKEGSYKVSKKMGDVNSVKEAISQTLSEMITPIDEDYPAGAEFDSKAPYNRGELNKMSGQKSTKKYVDLQYMNLEMAILKDLNTGELYVFDYGQMDPKIFEPYVDKYGELDSVGDIEFNDDFDIDDEVLENYVNDNFQEMSKGEGVKDFEKNRMDLVLIDEELKDELLYLYDKDSKLVMVLEPIAESTGAASSGAYTALFSPSNQKPEEYNEKKLPPVVTETDTASVGNIGYDNPGFVGISRDGKFPTNPKKTKAQKNTQWAGGSFVEFDDCTKLNNNKEAQKGKCSTGAANNVVKLKSTKSNINAPSLSEGKKYTIYKLDRLVKKNNI